MGNIDDIDKKIISLLIRNARMPLKLLAEQVFLTSPTVSCRIKRLENKGIISGYKAIIDPAQLGYHIMAYVNLAMPPYKRDAFTAFIKECSNVQECYHVAGTYSMIIRVYFKSVMELNNFVTKLQDYGKTQTQIVLSTVINQREVGL